MMHPVPVSVDRLAEVLDRIGVTKGKPLTRAQVAELADAIEVDLATREMTQPARLHWEGALVALRAVLGG
jgi:hypothetical protein